MKVLLLSQYSRRGASSRIRFYQYIDHLKREGIDVTVAPLLDERYIAARPGRRWPLAPYISWRYVQRLWWLLRSRRFDLLWIEAELFPGLPAWFETALSRFGVPYVVDYDDAVFHRYDQSRTPAVRRMLGTKVDRVMREAALVVAGNEYLAARAREAGARVVTHLPSVVDLERYPISPPARTETVTIGWIGSWSTAKYLLAVTPALREIARNPRIRLVVVGADPVRLEGLPAEARPWSEATEVSEIQAFDIGIMPLDDGPWERGKCGYKLIQYMACSKPAVASPVGANADIIRHGINGLHATTSAEWVGALRLLADNPGLRVQMGAHGRKLAEEKYSLSETARILQKVLCSAAERATSADD